MKKHIAIIITLVLFSGSLIAGESLFGISNKSLGMLAVPYSAPGMGRSYEIASMDTNQINYMNYSLWPKINLTSYSVKFYYKAATGDDGKGNNSFNDVANFGGGHLTIPILKRKLSLGVGLQPISDMEQRYKEETSDGNASSQIVVKGGLSRVVTNISYLVLPNLGVGAGYEYTFGKISETFRYQDTSKTYSALNLYYEYRMYGHGVVLSAFYQPITKLNLGLVYRPAVKIDYKIQATTNSDEVDKGVVKTLTIPSRLNIGAEYQLQKRWKMGADFKYQNWKTGYLNSGVVVGSPFTEYFSISGGIERIHSNKLFISFVEKMDLRAGGFFRRLSQTSSGNPVNEYGVSLGFSLPLQRFRSKIDFAGIIGSRGSLDTNEYKEMFFKVGVSVSAKEMWFIKLKD